MGNLAELLDSTRAEALLDNQKKRSMVLFRWLLLAATLALALSAPTDIFDSMLVTLAIGIFFASSLVVSVVPARTLKATPFEYSLSLLDTAILSYVVYVADPSGHLCLFFFILLAGAALSTSLAMVMVGSTVLAAVYLLLTGMRGDWSGALAPAHLLAVPVFYATGLHFGHQVLQIVRRRSHLVEVDRERQELRSVLGILESITSSLDFHTVMFRIASRIAEVVDAVRCSILLVREREPQRAYVVAANDDQKVRMLPVDLIKYPEVQAAIQRKEPIIIEDVEKSEMMRPYVQDLLKLNFRSLLVLPIVYQESVLGTLFLRAARKRSFTVDELKFCQVVASAAASAIKNSSLYQSLEERAGELERTGERLRVLLDNSPDLIVQIGPEGKIQEANRTAETLSGLPRARVLSLGLEDLLHGLPPAVVLFDQVGNAVAPVEFPASLGAADGSGRDLIVRVAPLAGPEPGLILIGRDVTERNQATAMLQQTEKLSSIGEIVAGVAHELNNPLSGVLGFSQLLSQRDTEGRFRRDIERIVDCAGRCQKIVTNLLSFARPAHPEKKPVGLNGILAKTLDLLEPALRADNLEITKELTADLPYVLADFHQIQQVLTNLIANAHQAITAGGRSPGRLTLRSYRRNGQVVVEVGDNGPGIPPAVLPRIFDPFFSTKRQGRGTGLGLSVSYGIIRDHGGEIKVDTRLDQGTTFSVILPIHVPVAAPTARSTAGTRAPEGGREILVVDDEEMIVELYLQLLQTLGHSADTASTGVEALRKLEARDYDLVITDIKMPKMTGIQLYEKVIERKPEMKRRFIFITGDMNCLTGQQYSYVTDNPCLLKPVSIEKIEATIHQVLGDAPPAATAASAAR